MNRILFDKTVTSQPGTFPFVTLPDPHVEIVPETGKEFSEQAKYIFSEQRHKLWMYYLVSESTLCCYKII